MLLLVADTVSRCREATAYLPLSETTQMGTVCKLAVESSKALAAVKLREHGFMFPSVFPSLFHFPERRIRKKTKSKTTTNKNAFS